MPWVIWLCTICFIASAKISSLSTQQRRNHCQGLAYASLPYANACELYCHMFLLILCVLLFFSQRIFLCSMCVFFCFQYKVINIA